MKLRGALGDALRGAAPDFVQRISVRALHVFIPAKGAEFAMCAADVRRIDVPVDVEIADIAVELFADVIRQPADGQQIVRGVERQAVFGGQAFASKNFLRDGVEASVGNMQLSVHSKPFSKAREKNRRAPENQE